MFLRYSCQRFCYVNKHRFFSTRPFQVLGLQQIAVGALEKGAMTKIWGEVLGLAKVDSFKSEKENVDEDIMTLGNHPNDIEVDLMTPLDPEKSPKVGCIKPVAKEIPSNILKTLPYSFRFILQH